MKIELFQAYTPYWTLFNDLIRQTRGIDSKVLHSHTIEFDWGVKRVRENGDVHLVLYLMGIKGNAGYPHCIRESEFHETMHMAHETAFDIRFKNGSVVVVDGTIDWLEEAYLKHKEFYGINEELPEFKFVHPIVSINHDINLMITFINRMIFDRKFHDYKLSIVDDIVFLEQIFIDKLEIVPIEDDIHIFNHHTNRYYFFSQKGEHCIEDKKKRDIIEEDIASLCSKVHEVLSIC